jgi:hypothetical protein
MAFASSESPSQKIRGSLATASAWQITSFPRRHRAWTALA